MIRKGRYCKYRGKIYSCSLGPTEALLRSHDIEDLEKNGFEEIDRYLFEGKVPKSEVTDIKEVKGPICKELKAPDDWNF